MAYNLSKNLIKLRKEMGFTQQDVADIFSLERSSYSYYETGKTTPSIETLVRLSRMYDVSLEELLGIDEKASDYEMLSEAPSFSFKKRKAAPATFDHKQVIGKLLELDRDQLIIIDQQIEELLDNKHE